MMRKAEAQCCRQKHQVAIVALLFDLAMTDEGIDGHRRKESREAANVGGCGLGPEGCGGAQSDDGRSCRQVAFC